MKIELENTTTAPSASCPLQEGVQKPLGFVHTTNDIPEIKSAEIEPETCSVESCGCSH